MDERSKPFPMVRLAAVLAAGATVVVALVFGDRFGIDPGRVDSPLLGQQAPEVELTTLESREAFSFKDLEGSIVVVNFFASWCFPCRNEHDDLIEVQRRYEDQDVVVMGIAYQDSSENVKRFLDELGRGYLVVEDPGSRTAIEFGVFGIPETFLIDRDGVIAAKIFGEADIETLTSIIDPLLAGERPDSITTGTVQVGPDP